MKKDIKCRLCESHNLHRYFVVKEELLLKCENCGFIQVAKEPSLEELNKIYSCKYFDHGKYEDKFAIHKEYKRRLELIRKYLKDSNKKVIDVCCASGDFISFSLDDYSWYGIDISDYAINKAKKRNPSIKERLSVGKIENKKYPENYFDGIVLWDSIEHIWNPLEISEKLFKYLKPNGYLFLSTPNIRSFTAKVLGKYWAFMTPPEHLSFLTKKNLKYIYTKKLDGKVIEWFSKGKWANFGFVLYKIKRIFPRLMPQFVINIFRKGVLKKISLYIPTGDIQYLVVKKIVK